MNFAFSTNGKYIVTRDYEGSNVIDISSVHVWDAENGHRLSSSEKNPGESFDTIAVTSDGEFVFAAVAEPLSMWISQAADFDPALFEEYHVGKVTSSAFSSDNMRLLTTGEDRTAKLWDAQTQKFVCNLVGHTKAVTHGQFSKHGTWVLTTSDDGTTKLWDADKCTQIASYEGVATGGRYAFSSKEDFIITAGPGDISRIWESETGRPLMVFKGTGGQVKAAMFNKDGTHVVTRSDDGTVTVFKIPFETRKPSEVSAEVGRLIPERLVNGRLVQRN